MTETTRAVTPEQVLSNLSEQFAEEFGFGEKSPLALISSARLYDKAYELACLLRLLDDIREMLAKTNAGPISFALGENDAIRFRAGGGPIDDQFNFVRVCENGNEAARIWVNVEFLATSAEHAGKRPSDELTSGDLHELDLVVVKKDVTGYPRPSDILAGVECKHRSFSKALLKELIGVRGEMLQRSTNADAHNQKLSRVVRTMNCCMILYCSNRSVSDYAAPSTYWRIKMRHYWF